MLPFIFFAQKNSMLIQPFVIVAELILTDLTLQYQNI